MFMTFLQDEPLFLDSGDASGQDKTAQGDNLVDAFEIHTEPEDEDDDTKICPPEAFDELYGYRRSTTTAATKQPLRVRYGFINNLAQTNGRYILVDDILGNSMLFA
jgi:hypothetical protein